MASGFRYTCLIGGHINETTQTVTRPVINVIYLVMIWLGLENGHIDTLIMCALSQLLAVNFTLCPIN